jgi:hypothetical protein
MSIANPIHTAPRVAIWRAFGQSLFSRLGLKILALLSTLVALLALAYSGHEIVAAWLGLMFLNWAFFIGAAKASRDED